MAKKVLTPEEMQAKLEKKSAKRNLFFGTFTKALAFFLVVAIAWSLAAIAFTPIGVGTVANTGNATTNNNEGGSSSSDPFGGSSSSDPFGGSTTPGGSTSTTPGGSTSTTPGGNTSTTPGGNTSTTPGGSTSTTPSGNTNTTPGGNTSTTPNTGTQTNPGAAQATKADVAKAINEATAKGAKASYDWSREAKFTRNIDVGGLTSILDGIIKGVDENASLNSVVGGFLGIKEQPFSASVVNGQLPESGMEEKYLLKAMALTEGDIAQFRVDGNKYMVQIKDCTNPDANSAWAHASNDYITYSEVNSSIAGAVGEGVVTVVEGESQANYKNIIMTAVIDNGQLTSLEYSYAFDANLTIKAGIKAKGTGAAAMKATYSNFKY